MKFVKIVFLLLIACLVKANSFAQSGDPVVDSTERRFMMDSLGVNDSIVNAVLAARDEYFAKTLEIDQDSTKSMVTKKLLFARQATLTNEKIQRILGTPKYDHYREMIQRRIEAQHLNGIANPLAGAGQ